jgi:hypothetical protein
MGWAGHVTQMGQKRNTYRIFEGKPERKRPLGRPRHMWVDNTKMDLERGWGGMDLINLAQDRVQGRVCMSEHGNESLGSITCWEVLD